MNEGGKEEVGRNALMEKQGEGRQETRSGLRLELTSCFLDILGVTDV